MAARLHSVGDGDALFHFLQRVIRIAGDRLVTVDSAELPGVILETTIRHLITAIRILPRISRPEFLHNGERRILSRKWFLWLSSAPAIAPMAISGVCVSQRLLAARARRAAEDRSVRSPERNRAEEKRAGGAVKA